MDKYLKEYASEGAKKTQHDVGPGPGFSHEHFPFRGISNYHVWLPCWVNMLFSAELDLLGPTSHDTFCMTHFIRELKLIKDRSVKRRAGKPTEKRPLVYCNDLHTSDLFFTARYISGWWWLEHLDYFPFHIWDVILPIDYNFW